MAVCGPPSLRRLLPAGELSLHAPACSARADFFIAFTKDNCDRSLPGRPVYRVERMGALLSVVLDRRDRFAQKRTARRPLAAVLLSRLPPGPDLP